MIDMPGAKVQVSSYAELNFLEKFLTLFTRVRPGEGIAVAVLFSHGFLVMGCYYLLRPLREALILSDGSAELRSYAAAFQAVALLLVMPLYSWLFRRRGNMLMIQWVNVFFVFNLALFAIAGITGFRFNFLFFIWVGLFNVMVIAQFWAFAADLFNVKAGQRLFAVIAVGCSLGAIAGARLSGLLLEPFGPYGVMLIACVVLASTLIISTIAPKVIPQDSRSIASNKDEGEKLKSWLGGFQVVFNSHYLMAIAALVVLLNWLMSNGDYILNQFVQSEVMSVLGENASVDERALWMGEFFSNFYSLLNIGVFFIQLFLVSRLFLWAGVHVAILILPVVLSGGFLLIGLLPLFALSQLVLGTQKALDYSLMNTTRNALFLTATKSEKYEGKTTIDTFFVRFGDVFSAVAIFIVVSAGLGASSFIGLNILLSIVLFAIAWYIGHQYRSQASSESFNSAPQVFREIPDAHWVGDGPFLHKIPADAFIDTDAGDVLEVKLTGLDMALPSWLRFDKKTQILHCAKPPVFAVDVSVVAVVRDFDGLEASSMFIVRRLLN
ncbi:MAG: AAA family ATP:ADP antiporter [Paraglaciecola psychrophila]|jgi:AAA family ATP:ADP antiporter